MTDETAPTPIVAASSGTPCANCGAPMLGPYCYACGQPKKGLIRHLASVMSDVLDTVFNIDSRVFHTLVPLYFRPGYLTLEYFAGRRVRYVTPFRLFFFLSLVAFLAIQASFDLDDSNTNFVTGGDVVHIASNATSIETAATADEVDQRLAAAVTGLEAARKSVGPASGTTTAAATDADADRDAARDVIGQTEDSLRKEAWARKTWIKARDQALAAGKPPPPDPGGNDHLTWFDGSVWDPAAHPLHVAWAPDAVNDWFDTLAHHMHDNLLAAKHNPQRAIAGLFSVLPQTLVVLMPLFAVLLKVFYLFKRRLYMEHLIVALHSHAFIVLSLLVVCVVGWLQDWTAPHASWVATGLGYAVMAAWIWLPVYLFVMQKRVYRQGWLMTLLKFCLIGWCYSMMVGFGLLGAAVASLVFA
jgi:hypothetical protein